MRSAALLRPARGRRASFLALRTQRHERCIKRLVNLDKQLTDEKVSHCGLPKNYFSERHITVGSNVLRNCSNARKNESLLKSPLGLTLAINNCLAV